MAEDLKEETKKLIQSVITSTPESVTIAKLKKDFRDLVGSDIPFKKLGFDNLEIYLLSISDTIYIRGRGADAIVKAHTSEKSAHVENLIAHQRKNTNRFRGPSRRAGNYRPHGRYNHLRHYGGPGLFPLPPPGFYSPQPQFYRPPSLMSQNFYSPRGGDNRYSPSYQPQGRSTPITSSTYRPPQQEQRSPIPKNVDSPSVTNAPSISPSLPQDSDLQSSRNDDLDNVIPCSVASSSKSVSAVKAAMERLSITPSRQTMIIPGGLESPSDKMCDSYDEGEEIFMDSDDEIPDVSEGQLAALAAGAKRLEPANINSTQKDRNTFVYNIRVPRDVQDNLVQLVGEDERNEGIWCGKLPDLYKERFGSYLYADRYGFPSLLAMCLELPSIFYCIQIQRGDSKLFDCRKPYPQDTVKMNSFIRKLENFNATSLVQAVNNTSPLPEDHMSADYFTMDDHIPRLDITSVLSQGDVISITIAEVYDPSKFWLHIAGEKYLDKLKTMMTDIKTFYKDNKTFLNIPNERMQIGLLCCAMYASEFHRAVIIDTNLTKSNLVKVYYLDYGTVGKVSATDIVYLNRQFGDLPQQAVRARLAGVYPREAKSPWSRAAGQRFYDLIYARDLFGHVDKINGKRQEVEVFLIDTSADFDMHISDKLVEEGLAIFTHDAQTVVKLDWQFEPIVQYIHLYPTFHELETGRVLTINEMDQLYELGVPYYVAYNHYFCQVENKKGPPGDIDDILEPNLVAPVDQTANWVQNIDNTNISEIISIADIEGSPFRRVITVECDGENFSLIRFNNKIHLIVQQLLNYFKKKDLSIIRIRKLCVHLGITIPCLTERLDKDLFNLGMEQYRINEDVLHLLPAEDVPIFYEKISNEIFSFDVWPSIEKILNFSSDIWVK